MNKYPLTKKEIDDLIAKYHDADGHTFPDWMAIGKSDNEVRYDYDSSKICYSLIREYEPVNCLEFGTSFGHSTLFILDALIKNGKPFKFSAFEQSKPIYDVMVDNVRQRFQKYPAGFTPINADVTLDPALIADNLDFVFIDTDHEKASTDWYLANVLPKCKKGALIAIHDLPYTVGADGKTLTKLDFGVYSPFDEIDIIKDLYDQGKLPLEKIFLMYQYRDKYPSHWEGTFWEKK